VIVDIAKIWSYGGTSSREVVAPQLVTDLDHRRYGMAHVEEPGTQPINPLDLFPRREDRKYIALDAFELFANLVDDWKIVVTDKGSRT